MATSDITKAARELAKAEGKLSRLADRIDSQRAKAIEKLDKKFTKKVEAAKDAVVAAKKELTTLVAAA